VPPVLTRGALGEPPTSHPDVIDHRVTSACSRREDGREGGRSASAPRPTARPDRRLDLSADARATLARVSQKVAKGRDDSGEPLLTVAARQVGMRRAFRVLTFMAAWDRARKAMRRESLTLDEYAEWWKVTRRTSYHEQALFREAFPAESTPDRLLDLAEGQWVERQGITGLGAVVIL
jgi:hypothetical protein